MNVSWKKGVNPEPIVEQINETLEISDSGNVTFSDFRHFEHDAVLHNMISFPEEIPEVEAHGIVSGALMAAARDQSITAGSILGHSKRLTNNYLRRKERPFILISSVSLQRGTSVPTTRPLNSHVTFQHQVPRAFLDARESVREHLPQNVHLDDPIHYTFIRVHTRARSPFAAAERALNSLDFYRSLLNLYENQRHFIRLSSGVPDPVNRILPGPLNTLHQTSGQLATDTWWYEPNFRPSLRAYSPQAGHAHMTSFLARARRMIQRHPYRPVLEDALIRYGRALDDHEFASAFQKLWIVLELLTCRPRSYERSISRVSFLYLEQQYHFQILQHLRTFRNARTHDGANSEFVETYLYQLKNYVERLFSFHLTRGSRYSTLEGACEFLDQPPGLDELNRQIRLLSEARAYRST